jgi:hypothetical protein
MGENAKPKALSGLENTRLAEIRPIRLDLTAIWNRRAAFSRGGAEQLAAESGTLLL